MFHFLSNDCREQKKADRGGNALRRSAKTAILPCAVALALVFPFAACGGDEPAPKPPGTYTTKGQAKTVFVRGGDVYVGGTQKSSNGSPLFYPLAVLWRNGEVYRRIPESGYLHLNSVFLAGNGSTYAVGSLPVPDHVGYADPYGRCLLAGFWKDGEIHYLDVPADHDAAAGPPVNESSAVSIFVTDGGDEYILGYVGLVDDNGEPNYYAKSVRAVLWENGEPRFLSDGGRFTHPKSIFVSGKDVYVVGMERESGKCSAVLWRNGNRMRLDGDDGDSSASSVFVQGDDVYVAGRIGNKAVVWRNGLKWKDLADGEGYMAHSVFVSGGDVYANGSASRDGYGYAAIWKNGDRIVWERSSGYPYALGDISVQGDDVYMTGAFANTPGVWTNGAVQNLPFAEK